MSTNNTTAGPSELAREALRIALTQLGQRETPGKENSGPMVDQYLKAVGLNPGYAWCQAFVNWCYEQAARKLGVPEPVPNTGGVLACWNMVAPAKKIAASVVQKMPDLIMPGDQFIMKIGTKGAGHTGMIISRNGNELLTIEGNTNDVGSREGYEVCRRKRSLLMKELVGIIRY